jgi:UDP:flavonoid glycosyltransferase YjiC (YdhE family)
MRFIIAAPSVDGHLNPNLKIAQLLGARGHEVVVVTGENRRDRVERLGLRFASVAPEAGNDAFDMASVLPHLEGLTGLRRTLVLVHHLYFGRMPALHRALRRVDREFRADGILSAAMFVGTIPYFLNNSADRPTIVQCCFNPLFATRDDGAPYGPGLPPAETKADVAQYAALKRDVDVMVEEMIMAPMDAGLATLGLPPVPVRNADFLLWASDVFVEFAVPAFEYPRCHLVRPVQFVGPLPPLASHLEDPSWLPELNDGRKIVLVTQGTLANHDLGELLGPTLRALAGEDDILVVVTTGGASLDALPGPLPANARAATYLPFDRVLSKVDVLVTNGGYGTVNMALARGIPCVVAGTSEEKAETAARVAWTGSGINLQTSTPSEAALRCAVRAVLDEPTYLSKARILAAEYARYDTAKEIVDIAESCRRLKCPSTNILSLLNPL